VQIRHTPLPRQGRRCRSDLQSIATTSIAANKGCSESEKNLWNDPIMCFSINWMRGKNLRRMFSDRGPMLWFFLNFRNIFRSCWRVFSLKLQLFLIITLFFLKKEIPIFFAENCRTSHKTVIGTSTPRSAKLAKPLKRGQTMNLIAQKMK
jgi:hypothetical protein